MKITATAVLYRCDGQGNQIDNATMADLSYTVHATAYNHSIQWATREKWNDGEGWVIDDTSTQAVVAKRAMDAVRPRLCAAPPAVGSPLNYLVKPGSYAGESEMRKLTAGARSAMLIPLTCDRYCRLFFVYLTESERADLKKVGREGAIQLWYYTKELSHSGS